MRPVIGITCDHNARGGGGGGGAPREDRCSPDSAYRYEVSPHYATAVVAAGGLAVMLPYEVDRIDDYLELCDGFILSGGDDPDTEPFGEAVHPAAKVEHPLRQQFETALLKALDAKGEGDGGGGGHPVLGICLGMQMMALHHGGRLHQHLPDAPDISSAQAEGHAGCDHEIQTTVADHSVLPAAGVVYSHHHQAVANAGAMRVCARSCDGVIEAIDLATGERFYLGVQWHPERTAEVSLGQHLFDALVGKCQE